VMCMRRVFVAMLLCERSSGPAKFVFCEFCG
jgi:hypothetical protein